MFRKSSAYYRFTTLLLPAILLWSWMACISICTELTEHSSEPTTVLTANTYSESVGLATEPDGCRVTAIPATFQDRQTVNVPVLANVQISFLPTHHPAFVPSVIKSDIRQNSPPRITVPLFLRLRNFRI